MFCRPMGNTLTVKAYCRKIGIQGTCPCIKLQSFRNRKRVKNFSKWVENQTFDSCS